jgi:predicted transcriptional regulator YdeE
LLIGAEVSGFDGVPQDLVARTVPKAKYAVFSSEKGPIPQIVYDVWKRIWAWTPLETRGGRAYSTDFEVYDHRAADPTNAQIDVFVSVK